MELGRNSVAMLSKFFGTREKPMTGPEFREFWQSLTVDEKDYYRNVDLETGLIE